LWGECTVPAGLNNIVAISTSHEHNIALGSDGAVHCWGHNTQGECTVPPDITSASMVAAGGEFSVALRSDGIVRAWGSNAWGACNVPASLGEVAKLDAGGVFAAVVRSDGTALAWGSVEVPNDLGPVVEVACGWTHAAALLRNGSVRCWGENYHGECDTPAGLGAIRHVAAGGFHTGALGAGGAIDMWGANNMSQASPPQTLDQMIKISVGPYSAMGIATDHTLRIWGDRFGTMPTNLGVVQDISVGITAFGVIDAAGVVHCWGQNVFGETQVPPSLGACDQIAAGGYHMVARKQSGEVACWGAGALSTGIFPDFGQSHVPALLGTVRSVAAGHAHSLAIRTDGQIRAWGQNLSGQSAVPPGLSGVRQVAGGGDFSLALRDDGTVLRWGDFYVPTDLNGVIEIAAGYAHAVALRSDGTVRCWGDNSSGQTAIPANLRGVTHVAAGGNSTLALLDQSISSCGNLGGVGTASLAISGAPWGDVHTWSWSNGGGPQVPGAASDVDLGNSGSVGSTCDARAGTLTAHSGSTLIIPVDLTLPVPTDHAIVVTSTTAMAGRLWLVASGAPELPEDFDMPVLVAGNPRGTFDIIQTNTPAPVGKFLTILPVANLGGGFTYHLVLRALPPTSSLVGSSTTELIGNPVAARMMDLNNDGFDDIAIAIDYGPSADGLLQVLLNDGFGVLGGTSVLASIPPQPTSLATGDVNGDGRDDVVVCAAGDSTGRLFLGTGSGTGALVASTVYTVNGTPVSVTILAPSGPTLLPAEASVAIGSTAGTPPNAGNKVAFYAFGSGTALQTANIVPAPNAIASRGRIVGSGGTTSSNVGKRGNASLVGEPGAVVTLVPDASGTYAVAQTIPVPGKPVLMDFQDIDGDGFGDIVTANAAPVPQGTGAALPVLTLFRGSALGLGNAVPIAPSDGSAGLDVTLVDSDHDGDLDILCVYRTIGLASRAGLLRVDTLVPGGPITIGMQANIDANAPILCVRGNLDGIGGDDFCIIESAIAPAFKRGGGSSGGFARPILSLLQNSACAADVTHDGLVNGDDLTVVLASFGATGAGDVDRNGTVGPEDLGLLLASWGACAN
jgi:alpha-tubulin suppressor-like RCC1 family protein